MPRFVSAADNAFWSADAVAQIVASPGAAPVMHPQRLYVRDEAFVIGDPRKSDIDPCRSHAALNYLKRKHQVNLATVDRPTRLLPKWATATPAAEAFLRRAGPSGRFLSPPVPPELASAEDRRRWMRDMAMRRRGQQQQPPSSRAAAGAADADEARPLPWRDDSEAAPRTSLLPADLHPEDEVQFERGEDSDDYEAGYGEGVDDDGAGDWRSYATAHPQQTDRFVRHDGPTRGDAALGHRDGGEPRRPRDPWLSHGEYGAEL